MKTQSLTWTAPRGVDPAVDPGAVPRLVLYFGSRAALENPRLHADLRASFPDAVLFGCSTGGHIVGDEIEDDAVSISALSFDRTQVRGACAQAADVAHSREAGQRLAEALDAPDLVAVLAFTDGLTVNGSELIRGLRERFGRDIPICGGMAGDGSRFERTLVGLDSIPEAGKAAAVGLYGDGLTVGWGSAGGWSVFGPQRIVTRSHGSIVEELDGRPAMELYTRYLDERDVAGLPGAALLFPLMVRNPAGQGEDLVRTILAVDHEAGSLTFAGDVPRGWRAQLMRGSISSLTRGAEQAGEMAAAPLARLGAASGDGLALLVSCIGRRLTLGTHTPYEIDAARSALPPGITVAGFYSYGEFAPHPRTGGCELHNQTMTIMTLAEAA